MKEIFKIKVTVKDDEVEEGFRAYCAETSQEAFRMFLVDMYNLTNDKEGEEVELEAILGSIVYETETKMILDANKFLPPEQQIDGASIELEVVNRIKIASH